MQSFRTFLSSSLLAGWQRANWLSYLLLPLSALFGALAALRRLYFRHLAAPQNLSVPVLVVGNIYVGGTGKTPFTIWLVQQLRAAGFTPGVISRGYGGKAGNAVVRLVSAQSLAEEVGDEPLLIVRRTGCPLLVGSDRLAVARQLLAQFPAVDVIISDDGLQHYALPRQIEIVLFDARGVGNGFLLPAGPLREPAARRRDLTVINGADSAPGVLAGRDGKLHCMQLQAQQAWQLADALAVCTLAQFVSQQAAGATILAAAGIGNPERFFAMLRAHGLQLQTLPLPDHHDFATNPFAHSEATLILITEKDAVKCALHASLRHDPRIWVVPVEARLDTQLAQYIVEKCRGRTFA